MPASISQTAQRLRLSYLDPLWRRLSQGWSWWMAELGPLVPVTVRKFFETGERQMVVTADGDGFVAQQGIGSVVQDVARIDPGTETAGNLVLPGDIQQTVLYLQPDKVLSLELTLPLAAEENLREVLSFDMDSQTPFTADQVYYDYVITSRSTTGRTLALDLFVTRRDIVDQAIADLANYGLRPDVVSPHSLDNPAGHLVNLLSADQRPTKRISLRRLNLLLAVFVLMLSVTALVLPVAQKNKVINGLELEVNDAAHAAQASTRLRQDVEKLVAGSKYLVEKKRNTPTMMQLLDELTRIIPDGTWVNNIEINNNEISLQGQSDSAAGLIALIEESPLFDSAQFQSPVTQVARTSTERFHLSAQVNQGSRK